jgi:MYXO-CTERM domain-containing protein
MTPAPRSTCPPYLRCEVSFTGLANCVPRDGIAQPRTTNIFAAGGGGCSVDGSATDSGLLSMLLLLLGAVVLGTRRRTKQTKNQTRNSGR